MLSPVRAWLRCLSNPALSRVFGRAAEARVPGPILRAVISAFVRHYGVDLMEAAEPIAAFRTFDAFFTRRLKARARPIDSRPDVVTSPCDAKVYGFGAVPSDGRLEQIKGKTYALGELLGDAGDAPTFRDGFQATLYLSPAMYHRVHWPADGRLLGSWRIPGRLYPVNALAIRHVDRLFTVNRRAVVRFDAQGFGPMALVMVGATNVGRIELCFDEAVGGRDRAVSEGAARATRRGDELGVFHFGSTVVLLVADPRLTWVGPPAGELVRMGQALWRHA